MQHLAIKTALDKGHISLAIKEFLADRAEAILKSGLPFTIAEFGCADGSNSIAILEEVIEWDIGAEFDLHVARRRGLIFADGDASLCSVLF